MVSQANKRDDGGRKPSYAAIRQGKKIVYLLESLIVATPAVVRVGKRKAGRPKAPPTEVIRIRLPIAVHTTVIDKGGDVWVKRLINEAIEREAK